VIAWVGAFLGCVVIHQPIFDPRAQIVFAILPLPAAADWVTQSLAGRESRNWLRLATGLLLGAAFTDLLASLIFERWLILLGGLIVLVAYLGAILLVLRVTGAWKTVLEEHFPGLALR